MKTDLIQPKSREAEDELSTIEKTVFSDYKYGFVTHIEADEAPKGLNEDMIRFISARKKEPQWMLEWRLKAYRHWLTMKTPEWANIKLPSDQLPGYYLLFCTQTENQSEKPG